MKVTIPMVTRHPQYNISGLYAVTPQEPDTERLCQQIEGALQGGAKLVQYRSKSTVRRFLLRQATALLALCRGYNVPLIINDHLDLCAQIGAEGIHLGQADCSLSAARRLLGENTIIGASCYNRLDLALKAQAEGASYVAFGACFPSDTKPNAVKADLGLFQTELDIPKVAIGGITLENASQIIAAGTDAIAVINALYNADDSAKTDVKSQAQKFTQFFN